MTVHSTIRTAGPPVFDTRFIGRRSELAALRMEIMGGARLITLVGIGGTGKSRLAAELSSALNGSDAEPRFDDGVVWVDLTTVPGPGELARLVAEALGLHDTVDLDPGTIARTVARGRLLLIMDSVERVSAACRELVDGLLAECPALVVMATSRVPLRSAIERLVPVPPMSVAARPGERSEAAELFLDRARRVLPAYARVTEDIAEINALCRRVGGIPLAIELAAPWIRTLSASDLLVEIHRSEDVLAARDQQPGDQHRSMRAVLESTWQGMSEDAQVALRRLSVFVGGFGVGAAEEVAQTSAAVLEVLSELSVIQRRPDTEFGARYGMHELVRSYADEMLHRHGPEEAQGVRARHLGYVLGLVERARAHDDSPDELPWLLEVRRHLADAGAALRWAHDHGGDGQALRLTAALSGFWGASSASGRYRAEFDAALALPWDAASTAQARARAIVLNAAGWAAMTRHDWELARRHFEASSDLYLQLGEHALHALGLCDVGWAVSRGSDPTFALGYLHQALALCRRDGDPASIAWATYALGEVLFLVGRDGDAERCVRDAQRQLAELGVSYGVYCSSVTLGHAYRRQGRWAEAVEAYLRALHQQRRFLHRTHGADVLAGLGVVALALDQHDCAARLFGACRGWAETHGDLSSLNPSRDLIPPRVDADARLADPEWAKNYAEARRGTTDQTLIMAEADAQHLHRRSRAPLPLGLSIRELEVMRLVSDGLTDAAIADQLAVSPRTVHGHLQSVYRKLGVKNRTAAVHRATLAGLLKPR